MFINISIVTNSMAKQIFRNNKTGNYTLKEVNADGSKNDTVIPAKYSPADPYGKYRRIARDRAAAEQVIDEEDVALSEDGM